jgi:hypothetical protein
VPEHRNTSRTVGMVSIVVLAGAAQSLAPSESKSSMKADQVITAWKDTPRNVAKEVIGKYGEPQEVTSNRLIWHSASRAIRETPTNPLARSARRAATRSSASRA